MAKTSKSKQKVLRVTLVRSPIGYSKRQKETIRALGFRRLHQTVEHADTSAVRGMVEKVSHLVRIEE